MYVETAYCYPTSEVAAKLHMPSGGYYVKVGYGLDAKVAPRGFDSPEAAYDHAATYDLPFGQHSLNRDGSFGS